MRHKMASLVSLSLSAGVSTSYKQRAYAKLRRRKKKDEIEVYRRSDRAEVLQHTSIHYAVCTGGKEKEQKCSSKGKKELS